MRSLIYIGTIVLFFACEDRLYELSDGTGDYGKEIIAKVPVERTSPMLNWDGPMELEVEYNGDGSSDILGPFELQLKHTEFYTGSQKFSVRMGSFRIENEFGDQLIGTYLGIGNKTPRNLTIKQTWIINSATGSYELLNINTLFAIITRSPHNGSSKVTITGNVN